MSSMVSGGWEAVDCLKACNSPSVTPMPPGSSGGITSICAGGPEGLIDPKPPGKVPKLNKAQRQALVQVIDSGPVPAVHGIVRWRLVDLVQWVWEEFRIRISVQTLSRELRALGYRKLSARPRHYAQDADAMAAFKKTSPPSWQRSQPKRPRAKT